MDWTPYIFQDFDTGYQDQVIDLISRCYAGLGIGEVLELDTLDSDLLHIPEIYAAPNAFKILVDGDKVIATVAVKFQSNEAELKRVFVDPDYRRQRIATKLNDWAFNCARGQGPELMHIWSGTTCITAHKMYTKLGAQDTGEKRFIGGVNDISEFYFRKLLN